MNHPIKPFFRAAILLGLSVQAEAAVVVSRLQSPQVIDGPNNRTDTPSRAFWNDAELSMYVGGGHTYNMRGPDLRSVTEAWDFYADPSASLVPGSAGNFDDGGAWILHAEVASENTNLVRGWYHAEQTRPGGNARKTMAYCESTDGGRTFQKVCAADASKNYPHNQFITSWTGYAGLTNQNHTGDGRIVRVGDYYYCYFMPVAGGASPHVARSAVLDHGRPGTWWKYYDPAGDGGTNGTWSEPGLGGRSSCPFPADGNLYGREMTWNTALNRFMLETHLFTGPDCSGIYLTFSTNNLFGWHRARYPLVVYEGSGGSWNRDLIPAQELHAYPGFAALDGATDGRFPAAGRSRFGTSFWYTVTYLNAHEGFAERYLLRQKVSLRETNSSAPQDQVGRVELALFRHRDGSDDWAATYNTFGHYRKVQTLGYLCTAGIPGTTPLYSHSNTNSAANHWVSTNAMEATKLSLLGYLFTNQVSGTIPLYRTCNPRTSIYSATTNESAPGAKLLLGYLFPPVGDETFAYRYDATEQTEVVNGGAESLPFTRTGQQGYDNWFFAERLPSGTLIPLTYNPANTPVWYPNPTRVWTSTNGLSGATLNAYGGTPGTTNKAVRQWVAIDTGSVYVSGRAFSRVAPGGDNGVNVLIQKNNRLLWQSTVTNGQSSAQSVSFRKWMSVTQGDAITFEIAPLSTSSTNNDTYFRPTIWFQWGSVDSEH